MVSDHNNCSKKEKHHGEKIFCIEEWQAEVANMQDKATDHLTTTGLCSLAYKQGNNEGIISKHDSSIPECAVWVF